MNNINDIKLPTLKIKGKNKRILLQMDPDGKVAIARFPDMTEKEKNSLLSICKTLMQDNSNLQLDLEKVRKFISFESDEDEFCS